MHSVTTAQRHLGLLDLHVKCHHGLGQPDTVTWIFAAIYPGLSGVVYLKVHVLDIILYKLLNTNRCTVCVQCQIVRMFTIVHVLADMREVSQDVILSSMCAQPILAYFYSV